MFGYLLSENQNDISVKIIRWAKSDQADYKSITT